MRDTAPGALMEIQQTKRLKEQPRNFAVRLGRNEPSDCRFLPRIHPIFMVGKIL